ncbi:hypothetical protein [Sorangium sp. So ce233]|uniref:hypothetical protein n=1 Tax=Sorangium sp. So ce233 TaxID=3133290 RepID=UPI003F6299D0
MSSTAMIPHGQVVLRLQAARIAPPIPTLFAQSARRIGFTEMATAALLVAVAACPAALLLVVAAGSAL